MVEGEKVRTTPQGEANQQLYDEIVEIGFEGVVVKDPKKPYASGRKGHGWGKIRWLAQLMQS